MPAGDSDYFLGIIEQRISSKRTGARWLLDSLANVPEDRRAAVCKRAVQIVYQRQGRSLPVHRWEQMTTDDEFEAPRSISKVRDIMTTDLFTVRPEDLVDLATSMMEWRHVRHGITRNDRLSRTTGTQL